MAPAAIGRVDYDRPPRPEPKDDGAFEALLFPNRSLPPSGFSAVMSVVISFNAILGIAFYVLGAWPVLWFGGLDIALVYLAFKLSYRQGRLHERVRLSGDALQVARVLPSGHESRWRLQAYWTRVVIDAPAEHHAQVRLVSKGRTLILGSFLSPEERVAFGRTLQNALETARGAAA